MRGGARGQASVEMALALLFGVVPLTLGLIAFAEAAWTYHGLTTITRLGARYAATHCFEDSSGQNVVSWLTDLNNPALPVFPDRQQLAGGSPCSIGRMIPIREAFRLPVTRAAAPNAFPIRSRSALVPTTRAHISSTVFWRASACRRSSFLRSQRQCRWKVESIRIDIL